MNNESTNTFLNKWDAYLKENSLYIKPDDKEEILADMAYTFEKNLNDVPRKVDNVE